MSKKIGDRQMPSTLADALKPFIHAAGDYVREELKTNPRATKAETLETVVESFAVAISVIVLHY